AYVEQAQARAVAGKRRLAEAMTGGAALYQRPADRRFGGDSVPADAARQLEADVLLSPQARLGDGDVYRSGLPGCK
ncbi:MAG: hypothetical protein LPK23_02965, partial [Rhodococcus sp. (in: high G+C Gram-positive bacteria)]|nr:hypothetical protein [Rhodococcus sp. (in: high G+C Gram-positive bacteria)]MDX5452065.1 hypothetical protein [Rhodococcus sp. (in: high G+C Gram-positive bacteria)]